MDTKDAKKYNSNFESIVTIRNGVVRDITGGYILQPRTHFSGGEMKWFDDSKLLKKGGDKSER